jgi:ribonuclease HI
VEFLKAKEEKYCSQKLRKQIHKLGAKHHLLWLSVKGHEIESALQRLTLISPAFHTHSTR